MTAVDIAGHIAYALITSGTLLLWFKSKRGFFLRMCGGTVWVAIGFKIGLSSIVLWSAILVVIDVIGYLYWQAQETK